MIPIHSVVQMSRVMMSPVHAPREEEKVYYTHITKLSGESRGRSQSGLENGLREQRKETALALVVVRAGGWVGRCGLDVSLDPGGKVCRLSSWLAQMWGLRTGRSQTSKTELESSSLMASPPDFCPGTGHRCPTRQGCRRQCTLFICVSLAHVLRAPLTHSA